MGLTRPGGDGADPSSPGAPLVDSHGVLRGKQSVTCGNHDLADPRILHHSVQELLCGAEKLETLTPAA